MSLMNMLRNWHLSLKLMSRLSQRCCLPKVDLWDHQPIREHQDQLNRFTYQQQEEIKKGCLKANTGIKQTTASQEVEQNRLSYQRICSKVDDRQISEKRRKFCNSGYFSQSKPSVVLVHSPWQKPTKLFNSRLSYHIKVQYIWSNIRWMFDLAL